MSVLTASDIHAKLAAVAPIDGISIGSSTDKSTWIIQFQDSATDAQKTAAQAVLDAIDLTDTPLAMAHKSIPVATFYDRLTDAERAALESSEDATVIAWRKKLPYCSIIEIDTEESEAMQSHMVTLGLFTSARIAEIFK
jgi:hypothetical protein